MLIQERRVELLDPRLPHPQEAGAARCPEILPPRYREEIAADRGDVRARWAVVTSIANVVIALVTLSAIRANRRRPKGHKQRNNKMIP